MTRQYLTPTRTPTDASEPSPPLTGHRIHSGIFYNVGGDVNMRDLRTHHKSTLPDRSHVVPPQLPPGSTLGLEEARDKGASQQQVVQNNLCPTGLGVRATRLEPGSTRVVGRIENGAAAGSGRPQDPPLRRENRGSEKDCGMEIVPSKNLKLIYEVWSGPRYFLHAGQNKGDAVIKVFNPGPVSKVRKGIMCAQYWQLSQSRHLETLRHPNILRLLGISSAESAFHFIVYENGRSSKPPTLSRADTILVHWKNAKGPRAEALKTTLRGALHLDLKWFIAGLSICA
ncbi:hypothetical protein B0H14DRAFT_3147631 [Mycena olivaceomarginata]|nr:hypothetical protein B0H14DRAFT_3147631 [Mycena olivaceomarginata]